jgi:predicted pyridoxine 5'-phosphate oxidase superfamily flavin-nucleotide-binding protein
MEALPSAPAPSPWHRGERAMQAATGMLERMDAVGRRVIRDHMPDQHRDFFGQLPFLVLGSVDAAGDAWASLIAGDPGFATSPDPRTLSVTRAEDPDDPAEAGLRDGHGIGLLGIELHTRRRNRMNGIVRRNAAGFDVAVRQSFGNCPQYIQLRDYVTVRPPDSPSDTSAEYLTALDAPAIDLIRRADTFFVASYSDEGAERQLDVSHRGGPAGFVRVADGTLTIPDFRGNFFFATLGNILLNGKAGLVFVDFEAGDLLQMTGDAALLPDRPEREAFGKADRLWRFRPRRIVRRSNALPFRWVGRPDRQP